jgi:hypothetical protein
MKSFTFILLLLGISLTAPAQKNEKPFWATNEYHVDLKNSYVETIIVTSEVTTDMMRAKAKQLLVERRKLKTGERVISGKGETGKSGLTLASQIVAEYIDYEKEIGYFLFQTLNNPTYTYDKIEVSDRYKFSPRVFVPGMMQIYKGSAGKGIAFIAGEALCLGGIITGEMMSVSYSNKAANTHDVRLKQAYSDDANTCLMVRNISIGAAAAVYLWNIIDGSVTKGKKHLLIGDNPVKISPYYAPHSSGIYLTYNF